MCRRLVFLMFVGVAFATPMRRGGTPPELDMESDDPCESSGAAKMGDYKRAYQFLKSCSESRANGGPESNGGNPCAPPSPPPPENATPTQRTLHLINGILQRRDREGRLRPLCGTDGSPEQAGDNSAEEREWRSVSLDDGAEEREWRSISLDDDKLVARLLLRVLALLR